MSLRDERRAQLGAIADELIPAGRDAVGVRGGRRRAVPGRGAGRAAGPRGAAGGGAGVRGRAAGDAIARAARATRAAGACSPRSCPAAYFLNPAMRAAIGYPGLEARPIDPDAAPDYLDDGLLDSVVARGPVYRPTP